MWGFGIVGKWHIPLIDVALPKRGYCWNNWDSKSAGGLQSVGGGANLEGRADDVDEEVV